MILKQGGFHGSDNVLVIKRTWHLHNHCCRIGKRFKRSDVAWFKNNDVTRLPDLITHANCPGEHQSNLRCDLVIMGCFVIASLVAFDPDFTGVGAERCGLEPPPRTSL